MTDGEGDPGGGPSLQVRRRPRATLLSWVVVAALVAAIVGWVSTHPGELPTSTTSVKASTPVGQPVYVGVFTAPGDFDRTLRLAGVKIFATSTVAGVVITPHLCRGGSLGVTTDPAPFCSKVEGTEQTSMGPGDEIVLEVSGEAPGVVAIDRIRLAYRDGVQWGTQDAGSPALVSLIAR
jgi:hypothetical protein